MSFMSEKVMKKANEFLADHLTENMSEEGGRVRRCMRTGEFLAQTLSLLSLSVCIDSHSMITVKAFNKVLHLKT